MKDPRTDTQWPSKSPNWRHFPDRIGVKNVGSKESGEPKYSVKTLEAETKTT